MKANENFAAYSCVLLFRNYIFLDIFVFLKNNTFHRISNLGRVSEFKAVKVCEFGEQYGEIGVLFVFVSNIMVLQELCCAE